MANPPKRFLLSERSLAVARVPAEGELPENWKAWAEKYSAIVVVPEGFSTEVTPEERRRLEALEAKYAVIRDVLGQLDGDGSKENPWNYQAMTQAIRLIKGMAAE